jgi:hypothetical protein
MVLAIVDSETQLIAIAVNFIGACLLGLLAWFARQAWKYLKKMHDKVDHIDECLDRTQRETTEAIRETRDDIVEVKRKLEKKDESDLLTQRELAYLKGIVGTPLDQPVGESRETHAP